MNRTTRQRIRLQDLITEAGTQAALASRVETADAYISQLLNSRDGIARKFCEKLEAAMNKPDGWMDQWVPEESGSAFGVRLSDAERTLLEAFRNCDEQDQAYILKTAKLVRTVTFTGDPAKRSEFQRDLVAISKRKRKEKQR